jgi:uncharacterized membrane protein YbaN (DUF454 family)
MIANRLARPLYLLLGWISVALGIVGVIFPLFPTTPFLLVAVWAFSRSSPELAEKIRNHQRFGALIRNWQDAGVVPVKAKLIAVTMMGGMFIYVLLWSAAPGWLAGLFGTVLAAVAGFIVTRPSLPPDF